MADLVDRLQSMTCEELKDCLEHIPEPNIAQKRQAWGKMETGIYSESGQLIGDKCEQEDVHYETI